ncbi:MAG: hypothetical protein P8N57_08770 [Flavobacteriaceae bacterium]|nr:hypothetical protein [Flavobacteriaceae bacterium]
MGIAGGFLHLTEIILNGVLIVLYQKNLELNKKIKEAEGRVVKDIFSFPGGRRFHFKNPSGNELAVWVKAQEIKEQVF